MYISHGRNIVLTILTVIYCIHKPDPFLCLHFRLGAHYRLNASIGTEQDFDVIRIIQHERYYTPNRWSNDVALLMLSRPAQLGRGVGLVCLSDSKYQLPFDDARKKCWITGWGTLYYYGPQPSELMQVAIPLVSKQRCMTSYPGYIDDSMICVGRDRGGIGACHGDSGGPLVCEFNGKWYLEGAASWTGLPCGSASKPTVYANIRYLKSWIISKIAQAPLPQSSCNFDSGLCSGWRQSYSDVFDWTRNRGSTSSSGTGPSSDHTTGSGKLSSPNKLFCDSCWNAAFPVYDLNIIRPV